MTQTGDHPEAQPGLTTARLLQDVRDVANAYERAIQRDQASMLQRTEEAYAASFEALRDVLAAEEVLTRTAEAVRGFARDAHRSESSSSTAQGGAARKRFIASLHANWDTIETRRRCKAIYDDYNQALREINRDGATRWSDSYNECLDAVEALLAQVDTDAVDDSAVAELCTQLSLIIFFAGEKQTS